MNQSMTITARQWRDLIAPVLPFAGNDMMLPVLNAVQVRTEGKWLIATASDRFRVGIKRIEKVVTDEDESPVWPEFSALIPLKAVRSIGAMLKPSRGSFNSGATLTIEDDRLTVEASGSFDLFDAARFTHLLVAGEFPGIAGLVRKALAAPDQDRVAHTSVNPAFLADFKSCGSRTLRIVNGSGPRDPMVFTDDEGFLGLLMPRRADRDAESWDDLFGEPAVSEPAAESTKAKPARKSRAKVKAGAA